MLRELKKIDVTSFKNDSSKATRYSIEIGTRTCVLDSEVCSKQYAMMGLAETIAAELDIDFTLFNEKKELESNAGFKIIAERPALSDDAEIVLAVRPDLSEYVTWVRYRGNEYYHGHYFHPVDFDRASRDYLTRE